VNEPVRKTKKNQTNEDENTSILWGVTKVEIADYGAEVG
jgi:hypothetical protein